MVSTFNGQKLRSKAARRLYDFDPGATTLTDIGWVSAVGLLEFLCGFFRTIGTGAVEFKILGNTAADGSGTDVELKAHAVAAEPDAVGDQIWLEISAAEIAEQAAAAGVDIVAISAAVSVATATDEGVVLYERHLDYQQEDLTADIVA
jgi:hypothetical protein